MKTTIKILLIIFAFNSASSRLYSSSTHKSLPVLGVRNIFPLIKNERGIKFEMEFINYLDFDGKFTNWISLDKRIIATILPDMIKLENDYMRTRFFKIKKLEREEFAIIYHTENNFKITLVPAEKQGYFLAFEPEIGGVALAGKEIKYMN